MEKQLAITTVCCQILDVCFFRLSSSSALFLLLPIADTSLFFSQEYRTINTRLQQLHAQKTTTVTQALDAKSDHLALVAENMYLKLNVLKYQALAAIYDEEAVGALDNYRMHLTDTSTRLVARQRVVEGELKKYKSAGSDMRGIVEKYSQVMRLVETVTRDIARLERKR